MDKTDLYKLHSLIINEKPFAQIRQGDGEFDILYNIPCKRQGFRFNPKCTADKLFKKQLKYSLIGEKDPYYLVGISEKNQFIHDWLKKQTLGTVIPACVFVNQNYPIFLNETISLIKQHPIILICNDKANVNDLPIRPKLVLRVTDNAWRKKITFVETLIKNLKKAKQSIMVLVAAGPYANVLIYKIWKETKKHWLINIGSTLDPYFYGRNTRKYHERMFKFTIDK